MTLIASILFFLLVVGYIFYPRRAIVMQRTQSQLDYLHERREVLYENLRDLNFEYRAGKYLEEDYVVQRNALEQEAAQLHLLITQMKESKAS